MLNKIKVYCYHRFQYEKSSIKFFGHVLDLKDVEYSIDPLSINNNNATTTDKIIGQPARVTSSDNVHPVQERSQEIVHSSFSSASSITFSNKSTYGKQMPRNEKRMPVTNALADKIPIRSTNIHNDRDNSSVINQASHGSIKRKNVHEPEPVKRKQVPPIETHEMFQVLANIREPLEDTNSNGDDLESRCSSKALRTMDSQKQANVHKRKSN